MAGMNIIGDIAGNGDTLERLLDKMPDQQTLLLGDLNDRGPNTKKVYDLVLSRGIKVIFSNHGHLMLDAYFNKNYYTPGIWLPNGGVATLKSFFPDKEKEIGKMWRKYLIGNTQWYKTYLKLAKALPKDVIKVEQHALNFLIKDNTLYTHAPLHPDLTINEALLLGTHALSAECDKSIIWNRKDPKRRSNFQIFGHNAGDDVKKYSDAEGIFALCLDTTRSQYLVGLDTKEQKYYREEIMES